MQSMVSGAREKYKDIINKTYSSMIPNGAPGERTSHRYLSMQEKYILPIETAGDFLVTDFLNELYEYRVTHENNKYLLFILYDIMPPREPWVYIRYLAPIKIEKGSKHFEPLFFFEGTFKSFSFLALPLFLATCLQWCFCFLLQTA